AEQVEERCARLIRCDTSNFGAGKATGGRAAAEIVAEELVAAGLRPTLLERAPGRTNVIARLRGTEPGADALLVQAHLDVVPAMAADWSVDPFAGEVRDGYVWGRGAVDMKDMCAMVLTVLHRWAAQDFRPRRDIVFAFVADEE